jgi:NitT/TauT family transport system substrate-binding protein
MTSKTKFMIATIVLVVAVSTVVFWYVQQRQPDVRKVTIGSATWPGFASGMIGKQRMLFHNLDVEYRIIDDLTARHAAFRSGTIDVMTTSIDLWVQESAQGLVGKAFLVTDESAGGDGIVARNEITNPSQLRGKKIAFARATPSHYLLFKVLQQAGLTPSDIQQIRVEDPGNAGQAFLGGSVDAAVTWEPFLTQVRDSGKGHILASTKDFPGIVVDVLVASPRAVANQDLLDTLISGWLASVSSINANPKSAVPVLAAGLGVKPEDAQGMMLGLRLADAERNRYYLCSPTPARSHLLDVVKDAGSFWKEQGVIPNVPDAGLITTARLCDTAH